MSEIILEGHLTLCQVNIPEYMELGFACKLGYPLSETKYLRVRRDIGSFTHHNKYGDKWLA